MIPDIGDCMPKYRQSRQQRCDEVEAAMRAGGGDVHAAAAHLGITRESFYKRSLRAGVDLRVLGAIVRGEVPGLTLAPPPTGDAPVRPVGAHLDLAGTITLTLADYALLRAGSMAETARLQRELDAANRIIDTLTRELTGRAA